MTKHYTSFLIRCWRLAGGERRLTIEHIQSGETTLATTLNEALSWLGTHWSEGGSGALTSDSSAGHERDRAIHDVMASQDIVLALPEQPVDDASMEARYDE